MNRSSALAMLLVIASALALRVPNLDTRPLHNDESVNAVKVAELWQHGRYAYDPDEYHGPTLHYATLPFLWLSGARNANELEDRALRSAPVAFGVGLILLLVFCADGLGRSAILWAALFTAISPAMVFYSRYFIHETLLVFFTMLAITAGWRYSQTHDARWAVITGLGVGLMFGTKETFVLALGAMALAAVATTIWRARACKAQLEAADIQDPAEITGQGALDVEPPIPDVRPHSSFLRFNWSHAFLALSAAFIVWLMFFSSFFSNLAGLIESVRTYFPWLKRAGGHSPHIHPWYFYLERLAWFHPAKGPVWTEALILVLAVVGAVTCMSAKATALQRFVAIYTLALTAIYSVIPYKTPWCLLGFFHGMILLAGVGAATVLELASKRAGKIALLVLLFVLTSHLAWQAWRANFVYASDRRNPYVYAQTVPDILNLIERVENIARVAPAEFQTVIKIIAPDSDYWPLPWYLRRFQHLGWYEKLPKDPFAPLIIVSSTLDARLDEKSEKKWLMVGLSELRPGKFFELYVELQLWAKYVATLPRPEE